MALNMQQTVGAWRVTCLEEVTSTNDVCRDLARQGAPAGTVVIAERQTAGRGRRGRRFFSPDGTGLYMSLLLRPDAAAADAVTLTAVTAVGCAQALEGVIGQPVGIKWVNDLYLNGKKICGILTEGALCGARLDYAVVGIGINLDAPADGFPEELRDIAGAAAAGRGDLRAAVACAVLGALSPIYAAPCDPAWLAAYRARSVLDGQRVTVTAGDTAYTATALGIDDRYGLRVVRDDGTAAILTSGEASANFSSKKG